MYVLAASAALDDLSAQLYSWFSRAINGLHMDGWNMSLLFISLPAPRLLCETIRRFTPRSADWSEPALSVRPQFCNGNARINRRSGGGGRGGGQWREGVGYGWAWPCGPLYGRRVGGGSLQVVAWPPPDWLWRPQLPRSEGYANAAPSRTGFAKKVFPRLCGWLDQTFLRGVAEHICRPFSEPGRSILGGPCSASAPRTGHSPQDNKEVEK